MFAGQYERIEEFVPRSSGHLLRMPLNTQLEPFVLRLDGFNDAVGGLGRNLEAFSDTSDGLMVEAVDFDFTPTQEAPKSGSGVDLYRVAAAVFRELVVSALWKIGGEIVMEFPTVMESHELRPVADPQDRDSAFECGRKKSPVEIKLTSRDRIELNRLRVGGGFRRQEIVAAGQEKSIELVDLGFRVGSHREKNGLGSRFDQRTRVGLVEVEVFATRSPPFPVIETHRNSDSRSHDTSIGGCEASCSGILWTMARTFIV